MHLIRADQRSSRSGESGFTIIEIIVAAVILAVAMAAIAAGASSFSDTGTKSKISQRQRAIGSAVLERVTSDSGWVKTFACGVGPCAGVKTGFIPANDPLLKENDGTATHAVEIDAVGVDQTNDGVGNADRDGIVPDVFEVTVTVTTTAPGILDAPKVYATKGAIELGARARRGGIHIRSCRVTPQSDERLAVGDCSSTAAVTTNLPPATPCSPPFTPDLQCSAWSQAIAANPGYGRMTVQQFSGITYTIKGPLPNETTTKTLTSSGSDARAVDLKPGTYELSASVPSGWESWPSKSQPSSSTIVVEAGETSESVQVFRPVVRNPPKLDIVAVDVTDPLVTPPPRTPLPASLAVKLVPVPYGRAPLALGDHGGWTNVPAGSVASVDIEGLKPGLYSAWILFHPGDVGVQLDHAFTASPTSNFVWVDPTGVHSPSGGLKLTVRRCDPAARRALIVARCPTGYRWCWVGGVRHGDCGEVDGDTIVPGALGAGGA